eukprot:3898430-Rhodomonas_salina.1
MKRFNLRVELLNCAKSHEIQVSVRTLHSRSDPFDARAEELLRAVREASQPALPFRKLGEGLPIVLAFTFCGGRAAEGLILILFPEVFTAGAGFSGPGPMPGNNRSIHIVGCS